MSTRGESPLVRRTLIAVALIYMALFILLPLVIELSPFEEYEVLPD
jgi:ABC-type sulfate transport system permease subunit